MDKAARALLGDPRSTVTIWQHRSQRRRSYHLLRSFRWLATIYRAQHRLGLGQKYSSGRRWLEEELIHHKEPTIEGTLVVLTREWRRRRRGN